MEDSSCAYAPANHEGLSVGKVIYISIDMLRGDAISSCRGGWPDIYSGRIDTPLLDSFAARGVSFTNCFSHCGFTTNSHATMLTGLYPFNHGIRSFFREKMRDDRLTIYQILARYGYRTCVSSDAGWVFGKKDYLGLSRGAGHYIESWASINGERDPELYDWLTENKDSDFFAFYHPFTVHNYITEKGQDTEKFTEYYKARDVKLALENYIGGINFFDRTRFRNLIDHISGLGILDEVTFIITADHGEEFSDTYIGHGFLSEQQLHVPLVIIHPGLKPGVVTTTSGLVDTVPTLLKLLGIRPQLGYPMDGRDLFGPAPEGNMYYAESYLDCLGSTMKTLKNIQKKDGSKRHDVMWDYFPEEYDYIQRKVGTRLLERCVRDGKFKYVEVFPYLKKLLKREPRADMEGFNHIRRCTDKSDRIDDPERPCSLLFNYRKDPLERMELSSILPDMAARMRESLAAIQTPEYRSGGMDDSGYGTEEEKDAVSEELRALGYID